MRAPPVRLAAAVAALIAAAPAVAQPPAPPGPAVARPAFSPYLNLLRGNTNPALNYYGLVRPQQQTQAALQSLQSQLLAPTSPFSGPAGDQPLVTGNAVGFQNYRGYFQNQFTGGAFGPGAGRPGQGSVGSPATGRSQPAGPRPVRR